MSKTAIDLPEKWEQFLKRLADDHQVDLNSVLIELFVWAFSNSETKKQFETWLDDAYPPKGEAEDIESEANEEKSENEEEKENKSEEEAHEDENYNEDISGK
jgi:hypothetical protein